jgi:tetratricopeptide (TPR) repeat protein
MKFKTLAVLGMLSVGCGAQAMPDSRANLQVLRREHTVDNLTRRGLAFADMGDLTRAEQYLAAALEQGASPRQVVPPLLHVCVAAGRHRAALVYAREYGAPLASDPQFGFVLAVLESAVGDQDVAVTLLRRTVRALPAHAEAHYQLALLLLLRGGDDEAGLHLHEYLKLAPEGKFADDAREKLKSSCGLECQRLSKDP